VIKDIALRVIGLPVGVDLTSGSIESVVAVLAGG